MRKRIYIFIIISGTASIPLLNFEVMNMAGSSSILFLWSTSTPYLPPQKFYYYACNEKWQLHCYDLFFQTRNVNNKWKCSYYSHCSFYIVKNWEFLEYNVRLDCETTVSSVLSHYRLQSTRPLHRTSVSASKVFLFFSVKYLPNITLNWSISTYMDFRCFYCYIVIIFFIEMYNS